LQRPYVRQAPESGHVRARYLMGTPSIVVSMLGRTVASVLVVAALLLLAAPASSALVTAVSSLWRWPEVRTELGKAAAALEVQSAVAEKSHLAYTARPADAIAERLKMIDGELAFASSAPRLQSTSYLDLAQALAQGQLEKVLRSEVDRQVLLQERDALRHLYVYAVGVGGRNALEDHIERMRKRHHFAELLESGFKLTVRGLEAQVLCNVPLTPCSAALVQARRAWTEANAETWRAYRDWESAKATLAPIVPSGPPPSFRVDRAGVRAVLDDMSRGVARVASWQVTAAQPIQDALFSAAQIVASGLVLIFGMKAFFFSFLAPLAQRRPPMVVREGPKDTASGLATSSALSLQVSISSDQELLAAGSHLQSVGDGASTGTKWLLSSAHPLTSLFSGLWMLTRLRATAPCTVVLSATTDPLEELNTVTLAEDEAMVLLPKHLVGVVFPAGGHVRLRGYWKVGLHAWLTLQFRYLVFEGPCTLIVAGCRGVRAERADGGRSVSQAMTVGFSSHLKYSVARTETFTAYLLGQRPLFHDRFQGPGIVLYQEVPSSAQRAGFSGRGLQGIADGAMKAFGL
jgi:hypothetical protein